MSQPIQSYIYYKDRAFPYDRQAFQGKIYNFENEHPTDILLMGEFENFQPPITHTNIEELIDFVQNDHIDLKIDNAIQLYQLGVLMKCPTLIIITDQFIDANKNELLKEFFSSKYPLSWVYEKLISHNFVEYIEEEKLMQYQVSVIHRIIQEFLRDNKCSRKIIDFIFKYIESDQPYGSILLNLIEVNEDEEYFLEKLHSKISPKYDLAFVLPGHLIYLLNQKFQ